MIDAAELIDDRADQGVFRVHRLSMTSQEVFELERERIFSRRWLYVGHDSEIEQPGEYRAREVGCRPVVLVRLGPDRVQCVIDACMRCGRRLTTSPQGVAEGLSCAVHGTGADSSMTPVPRVESYRGFWFLNFDPAAAELTTALGAAADYLDLVVDQSEVGMRILRGSQEFAVRANWKLYVENVVDTYHVLPVHQTYFQFLASRGGGVKYHGRRPGRASSLGQGHVVAELEASYGRPVARWDPTFGEDAKEEIAAIRVRLVERFGEERAFRMADTIRLLLAFPSFILADIPAVTLRSVNAVRPAYTVIRSWALAPGEESARMLQRRIESYLTFIGPGGFATPDDVEAVESCQAGFAAREVEWSDLSRGAHRTPNPNDDEVQLQAFWRQWARSLTPEMVP